MSLEKTIEQDLIAALKAKDENKVSTLRMLKSALKNLLIEKKQSELKEDDVLSVIRKELKKRQDSIDSYRKADREDLLAKEEAEAAILEAYLPAMLSQEEVEEVVDKVISAGANNFGQAMKEVMAQTKGQADGKMVQQIVKEKLGS